MSTTAIVPTPEELSKMTDAQLAELDEQFTKGQISVTAALAASNEAKKRRETAAEYAAFLADKKARKERRTIEDENERREDNKTRIPRPSSIQEFSALPLSVRVALISAHSSDGDNFVEQIRRKPPSMSWEIFDALLEVAKKKK